MNARPVVLLAVIACQAACQDTGGREPLGTRDPAVYEAYVHPILEARCATIDCHGDPGRALRLYAATGLRASDALRDHPMTSAELAADLASIAAVAPEGELLSRPLAGGIAHEGGDVWTSASEPQIVCVRAWLAGQVDDAACTTALAEDSVRLRDP